MTGSTLSQKPHRWTGREVRYPLPDVLAPETTSFYNRDKDKTGEYRPDGSEEFYDYGNDDGRLRQALGYTPGGLTLAGGGDVQLGFSYDGTLPTATTWSGLINGTVGWSYDNDFAITQRCIDAGHCIDFGYDNDLLLTQAGALSLVRSPQNGLLTGTELLDGANGLATTQGYNAFAELETYSVDFNTTALYETGYTRDRLGRIIQKTETIEGVTTVYDYLNQWGQTRLIKGKHSVTLH